jgi:WD40 repeat protein
LRLWNVNSGKVRTELAAHSAEIRALAFDSKGARAASGDDTGKICLWEVSSGKLLTSYQGKMAIGALASLDKDNSLGAIDGGSAISVWTLSK